MAAMTRNPESAGLKYLGIEGGGTRTVALLADGSGRDAAPAGNGAGEYEAADGGAAYAAFSFDCGRLAAAGRAGDWAVRRVGGGGLREDPVGGREGLAANPVLRYQ